MIDEKDIRDQGIEMYQDIVDRLRKDYPELSRLADLATEESLRKMSRGSDPVDKGMMYPIVFQVIFRDMVEANLI